jgi:hypothetical protein
MMFEKKENKLSCILFKYRNNIDFNSICDIKLKNCVKAQLSGNIHFSNSIYVDNLPRYFLMNRKNFKKLMFIEEHKVCWRLEEQEDFIVNSDWYITTIRPLEVFDENQDYKAVFNKPTPKSICECKRERLNFLI